MIHQHDFPGIGHNAAGQCRICTSTDPEGLIEHLAAALWESRRHGTPCDWPWNEAGDHWQRTYRQFAETAIEALTA